MAGEAEIILVSASVEIDDETVTVKGNTLKLKEGQGESTVEAGTNGGEVVPIISEDVTTRVGMVSFDMPASIKSMTLARDIKARGAGRVVRVSGIDSAGNRMSRTLTQGIMTNDPEKAIQNEGTLTLEFSGAPLIAS